MTSVAHIIRRRRQRKARRRATRHQSRLWTLVIMAILGLVVVLPLGIILGVAGVLYSQATAYMPTRGDTVYLDPIIGPTEIYDRTGETLLYSVQDPLGDKRSWLTLDELPAYVMEATVLQVDPDFLQNTSFHAGQTFSKLWQYILGSPPATDHSITGRLIRNTHIPRAQQSGLDDVILEIALTAETNRLYTPEEVLEWYLNTAYYGQDAYGIGAAAEIYLGKSASDLTLDEAALLAAIPLAPEYNPFDDETAARIRQNGLLEQMLVNGLISQADFETVSAQNTPFRSNFIQTPLLAPEFSIFARQQAEDILMSRGMGRADAARLVARGGLRITTTLDLDLYTQTECALETYFSFVQGRPATTSCAAGNNLLLPVGMDQTLPPDTGALILIDVNTGEIRSMVGAVTEATYQPGLTLHPFVYFEGFRSTTFTPAAMVLDIPASFPGPADGLIYTPTNLDRVFHGPLNLRDAMGAGLLPPAVQVADSRGISRVLITAHRIGINSLDENAYDLSLLERGGAVSVLDMTYAYSVFASMGVMHGIDIEPVSIGFRSRNPVAILRIEDANGALLWEYNTEQQALSQTIVFDSGLGYLLNDILADAPARRAVLGYNDEVLHLDRPAALVNGITSDFADSWTIGYTPQYALGVHVGRRDTQPMSLDVYGLNGAAPIWQTLMQYIHERDALPPLNWQRPNNIAEYTICDKSGLLADATGNCPTHAELFLSDIPPVRTDTHWQRYEVNSQTGQLATANTPTNLRTELVFFVPPEEALDWWEANGLPLPPEEYDTLSRPEVLKTVQLLQPDDFAYVGGSVDIRGSIDDSEIQHYQLAYGQGVNPREWLEIGGQQTEFVPGTSFGLWNTNALDGVYTLRLSVVFNDGSIDNDFTLVTIDNTPPTLQLEAGESGHVFRFPAENVIPLVANVTDNLAIERIEFYHNGNLLGIDEEWPYGFEFEITRTGLEIFRAVAFDQVGNNASSEITVEILRS